MHQGPLTRFPLLLSCSPVLRSLLFVACLGGVGPFAAELSAQESLYEEDLRAAERALNRGKLAEAEEIFDEVLLDAEDAEPGDEGPSPGEVVRARRGYFEVMFRRGRYDELRDAIEDLEPAVAADRGLRSLLAKTHEARGRDDDAERIWRDLVSSDALDLSSRAELALLLLDHGRDDEASPMLSSILGATIEDDDAEGWYAKARAHYARTDAREVQQAYLACQRAFRADEDFFPARVLYARIRYEVYGEWNRADSAESVLKEVLQRHGEVEDALILAFETRRENYNLDPSKTEDYLRRALAVNPNSVPALTARAITTLEDRRFPEATVQIERALDVDPGDLETLAVRAALARLVGDKETEGQLRAKVESLHPGSTICDTVLGYRLLRLYRFADANVVFERALEASPRDVEVLEGLARARVYSGRGEEAVELLERAKSLQPGYVDPWRNNVLAVQELLADEYVTVDEGSFVFYLHENDAGVLARYLVPYQLEAFEALNKKYGYEPDEKIRVEVLRTWDDFSVRTVGFRGFTALGVCFGPMITLVSPSDLDIRRNDFMWTATVWHEYAHVLTLALSNNRVPRFFTEGCSVHEEGARNPAWERGMERELYDAWKCGEIPPVRLMNRLFRGAQLLFGYYVGGELVDFVERDYGFGKVTELLQAWGDDLTTEQAFERTFEMATPEFDRLFEGYVAEKLGGLKLTPRWSPRAVSRARGRVTVEPDDVDAWLLLAESALQRGVEVDAAEPLRQALRRDPDSARAALVRADLARRRGQPEEALSFYRAAFASGLDDFEARMQAGRLLLAAEDIDGAIAMWNAAKACWPSCTDQGLAPELQLSALYRDQGNQEAAIRELSAFCTKTARAHQPRIELAQFARMAGDAEREEQLLDQCLEIDPFDRVVHERVGDLALARGDVAKARREYEVTLAIQPRLDRAYLNSPAEEIPAADDPEFRKLQADLCIKLANLEAQQGRKSQERKWLERAVSEAPDSPSGRAARDRLDR